LVFNSVVTKANWSGITSWTTDDGGFTYTTTGTPATLSAFNGLTSLIAVINIPTSGVTSIAADAFYNCNALSSITIPTSVTTIGNNAFYNCYALTSITIPSDVTSIGTSAFFRCSALTSITIPTKVTSIAASSFYYCYALKTVIIPYGVTTIGLDAFRDCVSLKSIIFPESVTTIGNTAFNGCTSLNTVYILSNSQVSIGNSSTFGSISSPANVYITPANSITAILTQQFTNKIILVPTNCYIKQSSRLLDLSKYFLPLTGTPGPKTGIIINNFNGTGLSKDLNEVFEPLPVGGTGADQPTMIMIENYNDTGETKDLNLIFKPIL
jgi:hypothetical protein